MFGFDAAYRRPVSDSSYDSMNLVVGQRHSGQLVAL
jgi:hypothetical protein